MSFIKSFRVLKQEGGFVSRMYLDGLECWTIERDCNALIPVGTYQVKLVNSPKFGPDTLWVCREGDSSYANAKMHNLIHGGNTIDDVTGCIAVGAEITTVGKDTVSSSQKTLTALKDIVVPKIKNGMPFMIIIRNLWEV